MLTCQHSGAASRTEYHREYQRKRRATRNPRHIHVELNAEERALLDRAIAQQRGPIEGAAKRLLLLGAKFAANAGTPRGKKFKSA